MSQHKEKLVRLSIADESNLTNFNCINTEETFESKGFKAKQIKKFIGYSNNINMFLKEEALDEQEKGFNTTHLYYKNGKLVGCISLCSDSIRLNLEEKNEDKVPYTNIPSLKIARLAIDINSQGCQLGEYLIKFAVSSALKSREIMGIKFITVDCYRHRLSYYEQFGFKENIVMNESKEPDNPKSLRLNIDEYLENLSNE